MKDALRSAHSYFRLTRTQQQPCQPGRRSGASPPEASGSPAVFATVTYVESGYDMTR